MSKKKKNPKHLIAIHCSASDNKKYDNIATMKKWHLARGWRDVGYAYFIRKDGTVEIGRDEDDSFAHIPQKLRSVSLNRCAIPICLHGLKKDKFTKEQFDSCADIIKQIRTRHEIRAIVPHNIFSNKTCPVFNIVDEIYPRLYEARFKR